MPGAEVNITISGLDELGEELERLEHDVQGKIINRSLKACGEEFLKPMKAHCPISTDFVSDASHTDRLLPGALQRDLRVRRKGNTSSPTVSVGPSNQLNYVAHWVEDGFNLTTHGSKSKRKIIRHIPGKPFVRPAVDEALTPAIQAFVDTLSEGVDEAFAKAKKGKKT